MTLEVLILLIVILLVLQAFFAGSEIALISCDKIKMRSLAENGSTSARLVLDSYSRVERFLGTSLLGINLCLILNTLFLTFFIQDNYGAGRELLAVLILSPLIVVFGQVVPKAVFHSKKDTVILWAIYPLWFSSKLFFPALYLVDLFTKGLLKLMGKEKDGSVTREELIDVIEGDKSNPVTDYDKRVLKRIFGFSETTVEEIMIPLVNVKAIEENAYVRQAIDLIKGSGHTRIPVFSERIDNIKGILHAFYLLGYEKSNDPVRKYVRPAYYVPESKLVNELLDEMKEERITMAVVVDEYGGAVGILTIEDILEEVVGEIEDEYDKGAKLWRKIREAEYLINPVIEIDQINDDLGLGIPDEEDYETLGGFLLTRFGSIPREGEKVGYKDKLFIVTKASNRAIDEVKLVLRK